VMTRRVVPQGNEKRRAGLSRLKGSTNLPDAGVSRKNHIYRLSPAYREKATMQGRRKTPTDTLQAKRGVYSPCKELCTPRVKMALCHVPAGTKGQFADALLAFCNEPAKKVWCTS